MNSQSCWELPTPVSRPETPHQKLEETWSDWATHIHPTAPQAAKRIPAWSSVADSRWTEPVHQTCGTRSHLLFDDGWNYLQLKQRHVSQTGRHWLRPAPMTNFTSKQTWNQCGMKRVCSDELAYIGWSHYVPTRIIETRWWWYLQISRRRWNSLNFILASWSWYRYPSIPFF